MSVKNLLTLLILLSSTICLSQGNHYPDKALPLSVTPGYSFTPNYLQNTASNFPDSFLDSISEIDLFVNLTINVANNNVYVVYTTDGSNPSKNNGTVVNANFIQAEGLNNIWKARITYLPVNSELKYIFYINTSDVIGNISDANNRISPNGFETSWTEGDISFGSFYVLPIKLSSFYINKNSQDQAVLYWSTFSECNSSHFEIQRSFNNINFEVIAEIPSQGGGYSCIGADYEYLDAIETGLIQASKLYYRLNMVDLEGNAFHSVVIQVEANEERVIFYNTASRQLNVENIEGDFILSIYDALGNIVSQSQNHDNTLLYLNGLASGIYFVVVNQDNHLTTEQIIVL